MHFFKNEKLFADVIIGAVLHPVLLKTCNDIQTSTPTLSTSTSSTSTSLQVEALPPPLYISGDLSLDDIHCLNPLTLYDASKYPPFSYIQETSSSSSSSSSSTEAEGQGQGGQQEEVVEVSGHGMASAFTPLSGSHNWAFGIDQVGKPPAWITPASSVIIGQQTPNSDSSIGSSIDSGFQTPNIENESYNTVSINQGGTSSSISFRVLMMKGMIDISYLKTYIHAGKVKIRISDPTEDSEGGFNLSCLNSESNSDNNSESESNSDNISDNNSQRNEGKINIMSNFMSVSGPTLSID